MLILATALLVPESMKEDKNPHLPKHETVSKVRVDILNLSIPSAADTRCIVGILWCFELKLQGYTGLYWVSKPTCRR